MNEIPSRECEAPRCAGLLLAALLLVTATRGLCGEDMEKIGSGFTMSTSGEESISGVDCFRWPATPADSSPRESDMGVGGSALVDLPRYERLWVGLISDARAAWWALDVSSSYNEEDDDWEPIDAWSIDSLSGNRIASNEGGPWNKQLDAKEPVPASIYKKLRPVDGSAADQLMVGLNSNPSGKAGCRIVVFAKRRETGE
jgi:hypothetical protein